MSAMCRCGASWSGLNVAHCGCCHETFSTVGLFDMHRSGGNCLDPAALKCQSGTRAGKPLMRRSETRNVWVGARPKPEGLFR